MGAGLEVFKKKPPDFRGWCAAVVAENKYTNVQHMRRMGQKAHSAVKVASPGRPTSSLFTNQ